MKSYIRIKLNSLKLYNLIQIQISVFIFLSKNIQLKIENRK